MISWALVQSLPVVLLLSFIYMPISWEGISGSALWSLAYVSLFSMLIGFVFWYRGLAQGGIAAVGQLQLLLALVLHESVDWPISIANIGVVLCVAFAKRFTSK